VQRFAGFTPETLGFLCELAGNNSKGWFEAHRQEYEESLLVPLKLLAAELGEFLLGVDPDLITAPTRVVSRIHRDTRFSRDKSPYKTRMWLTFRRQLPDWADSPCWFLEVAADSYRYGMGFYGASRQTMDRLREAMEQHPKAFREAVEVVEELEDCELEGEEYRRSLRPGMPEDLQRWYQKKSFYLACNRRPDALFFGRGLVDEVRRTFATLLPLYAYLWKMRPARSISSSSAPVWR